MIHLGFGAHLKAWKEHWSYICLFCLDGLAIFFGHKPLTIPMALTANALDGFISEMQDVMNTRLVYFERRNEGIRM
jgi:hypothetical protein